MSIEGITEADIASFLAHNPGFFERHAELLASVQLTSPHGARAVSLQERQMEMLRERYRGLEGRIMEMIRHSQVNAAIADRLHRWTRSLLLTADPAALPVVMLAQLQHIFIIAHAALRLWGVAAAYAELPFAQGANDDTRSFAASLTLPYCGVNAGFQAVGWLGADSAVASTALIPLRRSAVDGGDGSAFGLLVLGSPDATRYAADMGTDFLARIGDVASAALARLLD